MELPKGSRKEQLWNEQGTLDRERELRKKEITGLRQPSADNEEVLAALKDVSSTGLNVYAVIGKYKKVCQVSRIEDRTVIETCRAFLKYRCRIKGKAWPYFVKILHARHQTFKPEYHRPEVFSGPQSIADILRSMNF